MKKLFLSITIFLCSIFLGNNELTAQEQQGSLRERLARKEAAKQAKEKTDRPLTLRAKIMNENQTQKIDNAPWIRELYRFLDLDQEKNASLYFPVRPSGKRMNLFTLIFKHVLDGSIKAYEYQLDGSEDFSEKYVKDPEEFLKGFEIMYTKEGEDLIVEDVDMPSNEVLGYFVKEAWYFDKNNSVVDVKTLAICPVLIRQDDFSAESTKYPMFWIPYESIRPYTSEMPIMLSSLNNASTQTINDFFVKRNYDGEIYKTTNVRNLSLTQMFPADSLVQKEQEKIENQLQQFKDNLWVYNDSIGMKNRAETLHKKGGKRKNITSSETVNNTPSDRATVQKQAKSRSVSSRRSMRNRKRY